MADDSTPTKLRNDEPAFAKFRTLWHSTNNTQKYAANVWLSYSLFYWLLPTALVAVGLWIAKRSIVPRELWIHGEFLIYSITLTAGSTRLIAKDMSQPFPNRQVFNLVAQIIIFPAIFIYGLVRYLFTVGGPEPINYSLMTNYSIALLVISFVFSYVVFRVDTQLANIPAIIKEAADDIRHEPEKLGNTFEDLQEGGALPPISGEGDIANAENAWPDEKAEAIVTSSNQEIESDDIVRSDDPEKEDL